LKLVLTSYTIRAILVVRYGFAVKVHIIGPRPRIASLGNTAVKSIPPKQRFVLPPPKNRLKSRRSTTEHLRAFVLLFNNLANAADRP
jgi:hypothetical protein